MIVAEVYGVVEVCVECVSAILNDSLRNLVGAYQSVLRRVARPPVSNVYGQRQSIRDVVQYAASVVTVEGQTLSDVDVDVSTYAHIVVLTLLNGITNYETVTVTEVQTLTACSSCVDRLTSCGINTTIRNTEREEGRETHSVSKQVRTRTRVAVGILEYLLGVHHLGTDAQPLLNLRRSRYVSGYTLHRLLLSHLQQTVLLVVVNRYVVRSLARATCNSQVVAVLECIVLQDFLVGIYNTVEVCSTRSVVLVVTTIYIGLIQLTIVVSLQVVVQPVLDGIQQLRVVHTECLRVIHTAGVLLCQHRELHSVQNVVTGSVLRKVDRLLPSEVSRVGNLSAILNLRAVLRGDQYNTVSTTGTVD